MCNQFLLHSFISLVRFFFFSICCSLSSSGVLFISLFTFVLSVFWTRLLPVSELSLFCFCFVRPSSDSVFHTFFPLHFGIFVLLTLTVKVKIFKSSLLIGYGLWVFNEKKYSTTMLVRCYPFLTRIEFYFPA